MPTKPDPLAVKRALLLDRMAARLDGPRNLDALKRDIAGLAEATLDELLREYFADPYATLHQMRNNH